MIIINFENFTKIAINKFTVQLKIKLNYRYNTLLYSCFFFSRTCGKNLNQCPHRHLLLWRKQWP